MTRSISAPNGPADFCDRMVADPPLSQHTGRISGTTDIPASAGKNRASSLAGEPGTDARTDHRIVMPHTATNEQRLEYIAHRMRGALPAAARDRALGVVAG